MFLYTQPQVYHYHYNELIYTYCFSNRDELARLRQDHKRRRALQREAYRAGILTNERTHSEEAEAIRNEHREAVTRAVQAELWRIWLVFES